MFPEHSRSRLAGWVREGAVQVDGDAARPRMRVAGGERVQIQAPAVVAESAAPAPMHLELLFEDAHVLVVDKPAGLVVHPGAGNPDGTLVNGLLHYDPGLAALPRAGLVHRIDKDTSGVLLVARTLEAHTALVRALAERRIHRRYRAICHGELTGGGTVDAPVGRHPRDRLRMTVRDDGRQAVTHYRIAARYTATTAVEVTLETGRTHQIRVHFAHLRHPLVGDAVYGGRRRIPPGGNTELNGLLARFPRQALHAQELAFEHPANGDAVAVSAPVPDDMVTLEAALRDMEG